MKKVTGLDQRIINHAIDGINDRLDSDLYGCDLHNSLFNEDYFIIGTYKAKQWLNESPGVFEAIEVIKNYEQDNFGQVSTDLSNPEKVVNMYAYIIGEEVLNESQTLRDNWDVTLDEETMKAIIEELENL